MLGWNPWDLGQVYSWSRAETLFGVDFFTSEVDFINWRVSFSFAGHWESRTSLYCSLGEFSGMTVPLVACLKEFTVDGKLFSHNPSHLLVKEVVPKPGRISWSKKEGNSIGDEIQSHLGSASHLWIELLFWGLKYQLCWVPPSFWAHYFSSGRTCLNIGLLFLLLGAIISLLDVWLISESHSTIAGRFSLVGAPQ